jgi:hypothetical protein
LAEHQTDHPLGCHRRRIPERVVFEKLVQVLLFGCAYERIADASCKQSTLRRRREEWIELGVMEHLRQRSAWKRLPHRPGAFGSGGGRVPHQGIEGGGQKAGRSPVDRGKRGVKRSMAVDAKGIPLGAITAPAKAATTLRCWSPP